MHMTLSEFRRKYSTERACLKALLEFRMNETRLCFNHQCQAPIDRFYKPHKKRKAFLCARCLRHIFPMAGTMFDHTHVPLQNWFELIFQFLLSRNSVSAFEVCRTLGCSYPTAFRVMHAIRKQMLACLHFDLDNTVVEIDESYIKTGTKGLGRHYDFGRGRGSLHTTTILAIVERRGRAKMFVIPSAEASSILPIIKENVPKETIIYTDCWRAYSKLKDMGYKHMMVNHEVSYVDGPASTNSCEGLFGIMKRSISPSEGPSAMSATEDCRII
jgi:transposase